MATPATTPKRRALTPAKSRQRHPENDEEMIEATKRHQLAQQRKTALAALVASTPRKQFLHAEVQQRPLGSLSPSREQTLERAENLAEIYTKAVSLCNNNKITSQNAWTMGLIDHLNRFAETPVDGETNFQRASTALEAGAKIYSVRVDDVYTHAYRMVAGLNRADSSTGDGHGEGDGEENGQAAPEGKKKQRKVHAGRTIEKKLSNINTEGIDLAPEANLLLRQTELKGDETGAAALLLTRLPTIIGCQLAFDGMPVFNPMVCSPDTATLPATTLDFMSYRAECLPTAAQLANASLTHALEHYSFGPSVKNPLQVPTASPVDLHETTYDEALWETAAAPKQTDWCVHEASFNDDGGDLDEGICDSPRPAQQAQARTVVSVIANANAGQYAYLPILRATEWAGPDHWKPRSSAQAGIRKEGGKGKPAKAKYELDFTKSLSINWSAELAIAKTGLSLAKATLESQSEGRTKLPKDMHYQEHLLRSLLTRPDLLVDHQERAVEEDRVLGPDIESYDYNNARDAEYVAPDDDDAADDPAHESFGQSNGDNYLHDGEDMASALVAAPQLVGHARLNYARLAKQVDVQALKDGLWSQLGVEAAKVPNVEGSSVSFQDAVLDLPKALGSMGSSLSVPLCFVCLLHLANERGLRITSTPGLDDLRIG